MSGIAESGGRRQQPRKVALLVETSNAYARGLLRGIESYIRIHGPWSVYLAEHERGYDVPAWLSRWKGNGILARVENDQIARALRKLKLPVVDLSSNGLIATTPVATTDNASFAALAFQHFTERGFRHFAYCGDNRFAWSVARGRYFDELVRQAGLTCEHFTALHGIENAGDAQTDAMGQWLRGLALPVAVFACYDARGQQVLDACRRVDLSVPEQVAVLGVDNDEVLCPLSPPPLSSVIPNTTRTGWLAAEMLDLLMAGEKLPPTRHLVPPLGIATRQSTDTHAVDDPQLARVLHFIRENACGGISVGHVLKHFPMSRRVLEQRMKSLIGRTPHEEILRLQIGRAKELLAATKLTLPQIAERSGFQHAEYFSVVFKREEGSPPSAYRRRIHGVA